MLGSGLISGAKIDSCSLVADVACKCSQGRMVDERLGAG